VAVVYAFSRVAEPDALCLLPDDAESARLAGEYLPRGDRRRPAHVPGPANRESARLRRQGMTAALAAYGIDLPDRHVLLRE
jgi:LacI family transcriptional regulator